MANPTMLSLIQEYFPVEEWNNAQCIVNHECPPGDPGYPCNCVREVGPISCLSVSSQNGRALGPFGLLDTCWDPGLNSASPFTADAWHLVLDPNVNAWMASVIWSHYGWSAWTTCPDCNLCDRTTGGDIPHPDGPLVNLSFCPTPPPPEQSGSSLAPYVVAGAGIALGLILIFKPQ